MTTHTTTPLATLLEGRALHPPRGNQVPRPRVSLTVPSSFKAGWQAEHLTSNVPAGRDDERLL